MKRFPFVMLTTPIMLLIYCGKDEGRKPIPNINIKMKVGVVLKSGDVKNVARQDFIFSKVDIVSLWKAGKSSLDRQLIEKELVDKMGYDAKISEYGTKIKSLQDAEKRIADSANASMASVRKKLREHAEITYQKGLPLGVGNNFLGFRVEPLDIDRFRENITELYTKIIGSNISAEARQFLFARMVDLETIEDPRVGGRNEERKVKSDILGLSAEREAYEQSFRQMVTNEYEARAKISYLGKLKESPLVVVKTDLNGEASVALQRGEYYIFGHAEIGENFIAWNYRVNITEDGQYIELSNDNAYSFSREDVSELLEFLSESPTGSCP